MKIDIPPDPLIVARLKAIDPGLSVDWVELPDGSGRWGVFHDLQVDGRFEESVEALARRVQDALLAEGVVRDFHSCCVQAAEAVKLAKLVCYVINDDGSFRPLDHRIVKKFEEMDYYRRNLGLGDWKEMMRKRWDAVRESRDRAIESVYESVKTDKVFAKCVSDILWGMRPVRSVHVAQEGVTNENRECVAQEHGGDGSG